MPQVYCITIRTKHSPIVLFSDSCFHYPLYLDHFCSLFSPEQSVPQVCASHHHSLSTLTLFFWLLIVWVPEILRIITLINQQSIDESLTLVSGLLQRSIDLAVLRLSLLHQVSHHSHSWGRDLIGTWWIMLLGRSWSRLAKLLGS